MYPALKWSNKSLKNAMVLMAIGLYVGNVSDSNGQKVDVSNRTPVAVAGRSAVQVVLNGKSIRALVDTHRIDIGGSSPPRPDERKTNCTYSRFPCSQIDSLNLFVDDKPLFVPRSVFADLADAGAMSLAARSGLNVLTISGGDASEGYTVRIYFDGSRLLRRELYANEANHLTQETIYKAPAVLE